MCNTTFYQYIQKYSWEEIHQKIYSQEKKDVEAALAAEQPNMDHLLAMISPAAEPYLEQMAQRSRQLTQQRFGKTMRMYIPLYLSNYCSNGCVYCGFNAKNDIPRKKLTKEEIIEEAKKIKELGFRNLLLVTGEDHRTCPTSYLIEAVELLKPLFDVISIEVQPLEVDDYKALKGAGIHAVYVYQETYRENTYKDYHKFGRKRNFQYRLTTPERIAQAGVHKLGLGALLGLEDWRTDAFFVGLHLTFMERYYWKTQYSISFPRLRPHVGNFPPKSHINDRELLQLICAFRIYNPFVEMTLSTRESAHYRDNLIQLGITSMSAGSKTEPGGYAKENKDLKQFEVEDARTPKEVTDAIEAHGYEVVWKDWDGVLA